MKKFKSATAIYLTLGLMIFASLAPTANAQQTRRSERDVRDILRGLDSKMDDFRYSLDNVSGGTTADRQTEDEISAGLKNLSDSLRKFDGNFQKRRENASDVSDILRSAKYVNNSLNAHNLNGGRVQTNWTEIRGLIDRLAANYGVRQSWDDQSGTASNDDAGDDRFPNNNNRAPIARPAPNRPTVSSNAYGGSVLSGTYTLDAARSENTREIADRAAINTQNAAARADLEGKLEAPDQITVDVRGNRVTMTSARAGQITLTADGREQAQTVNGKNVRTRATFRGQDLVISSLGGDSDYTVTFTPIDNGSAMRVTRRVTTEYLNETVFAESVYRKIGSAAQTNNENDSDAGYSSSDQQDTRGNYPNGNYPNPNRPTGNYPPNTTARTGEFIVANGTILTGILENDIDAGVSQNNDRFRMTVQSPNEYRGAVIEGYLSGINRSGRVSGRSQITLNFERITLANGQTYDFAGFLQNVTDEKGDSVKIDTEGTVRGDSQTKETVKRGGIGAGLGAIIGGVIGGGGGAAIGAVIGGGAGAGSVVLQGRDELKLRKGSSITVQSSSSIR